MNRYSHIAIGIIDFPFMGLVSVVGERITPLIGWLLDL